MLIIVINKLNKKNNFFSNIFSLMDGGVVDCSISDCTITIHHHSEHIPRSLSPPKAIQIYNPTWACFLRADL